MKKLSILSVLLLSFLFVNTAAAQKLKGEGPVVSQNLDVRNFTGIELSFSGDVFLRQGKEFSVRVEGQQNLISVLNTEVKDNIWKLRFNVDNVQMYKTKFEVYITMPTLDHIHVAGSGNVRTENRFTGLGDVYAGVHGSGDVYLHADCRNLTAKVSGSGDIRTSGSAEAGNLKVTGSGDYSGYDMRIKNCEAAVTGSGDIKVHASETLIASVRGSGDIDYRGNPSVQSKVSGSGDIDRN